jgi:predicted glycosyltransferase
MKKLLVYSHDTYGLGNLRRMTAICRHLAAADSELSILLVSGSPMAHGFRLGAGVDYIKLPCLTRTGADGYAAKFLPLDIAEAVKLRSHLLLSAVTCFAPDLVIVDKKPFGVKSELRPALRFVREQLPRARAALILRDILDAPEVTKEIWRRHGYFQAIEDYYDVVPVLGEPGIFDPRREYDFPPAVAAKVRFCGYVRREPGRLSADEVRLELGLAEDERLIVVTPGGGEDGFDLVKNYLAAVGALPPSARVFSLVVSGPEMRSEQRQRVQDAVAATPRAALLEFTDDLMSYLGAAEVVVAMGGYNTVAEILSLRRKAVLVPRARPVREQLIRAERLAELGLLSYVHPDRLTPEALRGALTGQLQAPAPSAADPVRFDALPNIAALVNELLARPAAGT